MIRPTVLVVEDEPALLTLLRYNLEKEGFAVHEAHDGEEALLQLRDLLALRLCRGRAGAAVCKRRRALCKLRAQLRDKRVLVLRRRALALEPLHLLEQACVLVCGDLPLTLHGDELVFGLHALLADEFDF